MGEDWGEGQDSTKTCSECGHTVRGEAAVCDRCGNVFRKQSSEQDSEEDRG